MRDLRQARAVLAMANKDFKAMKGMMDRDVFDEEIFGFHAQQAIEKCLKAWLALRGEAYPLTHDISALLNSLGGLGESVEQYWDLLEYNVYAVRFRYESLQIYDESLDRNAAVQSIGELVAKVQRILDEVPEE